MIKVITQDKGVNDLADIVLDFQKLSSDRL